MKTFKSLIPQEDLIRLERRAMLASMIEAMGEHTFSHTKQAYLTAFHDAMVFLAKHKRFGLQLIAMIAKNPKGITDKDYVEAISEAYALWTNPKRNKERLLKKRNLIHN